MKYKLSNVSRTEVNTKFGMKPKIDCTITDEAGVITEKVSIWSSFADFANLKDGDIVVGELEVKQNGNYTNKTLKSPATGNIRPSTGYKNASVEKAMEKKEASIEKFQSSKEEGIKISGTMRDAVLCAIAEYQKDAHNLDSLEDLIRKWRKTLWFVYDEHSKFPPFL